MRRVLFFLVVLFIGYTVMVYGWGDGARAENELPFTEEVAAGATLWRRHNCQGCHQLYGLGGYLGPDLTNVARTKGPAYMQAFIKNGSTRMPNFQLSDAAVSQLTEYLIWVDASGLSLPPAGSTHWTGTYQINQR